MQANYGVLLSAWLVSMEIYPKRIFISIWHPPVQIKVHKENIRTKLETSDAYSEPCQTSKMKLFSYLTFLLLFLLSKLKYTEAYLEPSETSKIKLFTKIVNSF